MKSQKLLIIILIFAVDFLFVSCQPSVRFAGNKQNDNDNFVEKSAKKDIKNTSFAEKTTQNNTQRTTHYDRPAQIIYPPNYSNKYSNRIVTVAKRWIGVPYLYGGNTRKGVDCSGFVKNVYAEIGVNLPRTSAQQFLFAVPTVNPVVGDLVFFRRNGRIYHVGIYLGNKNIIHSAINKGVKVESIVGNSLEKTFAGYGRVT